MTANLERFLYYIKGHLHFTKSSPWSRQLSSSRTSFLALWPILSPFNAILSYLLYLYLSLSLHLSLSPSLSHSHHIYLSLSLSLSLPQPLSVTSCIDWLHGPDLPDPGKENNWGIQQFTVTVWRSSSSSSSFSSTSSSLCHHLYHRVIIVIIIIIIIIMIMMIIIVSCKAAQGIRARRGPVTACAPDTWGSTSPHYALCAWCKNSVVRWSHRSLGGTAAIWLQLIKRHRTAHQ